MSCPLEDGSPINAEGEPPAPPEPVRIIHKEQDSISAFCLNQVIMIDQNGGLKREYNLTFSCF